MRFTKVISTWPIGYPASSLYEAPICEDGKVALIFGYLFIYYNIFEFKISQGYFMVLFVGMSIPDLPNRYGNVRNKYSSFVKK